jgi:adenylate kinase
MLRPLWSWFKHFFDFKKRNIQMINLILFGPPGSGKGTQASKLVVKYELLHISTGDLFRSEIGNNTDLGIRAKEYMERGELVPDEITIGMLRNRVKANRDVKGYIFDGFPRTEIQANALDKLLAESGETVTGLIALDVPDDEIVRRLLLRGKSSGRADDSDVEIIKNRIEVYKNETAMVFDYYDTLNKSYSLYGLGTIEEIFDKISKVMDNI